MANPLLQIDTLTKSFGNMLLFEDISFGIAQGDRIGLIARNGTGKTTLLNVISGKSGFDGDVSPFDRPNQFSITYLTQDPDFDDAQTILETVLDEQLPQMRAIIAYEKMLSVLTENNLFFHSVSTDRILNPQVLD